MMLKQESTESEKSLNNVIKIDPKQIRNHLDQMVQFAVEKPRSMELRKAAEMVADGVSETMSYYAFPQVHWRQLRTNSPMERIMREIRRRTRVVGSFPDGHSALMLAAARLRHIAGGKWGLRRYMDMEHLQLQDKEMVAAGA